MIKRSKNIIVFFNTIDLLTTKKIFYINLDNFQVINLMWHRYHYIALYLANILYEEIR